MTPQEENYKLTAEDRRELTKAFMEQGEDPKTNLVDFSSKLAVQKLAEECAEELSRKNLIFDDIIPSVSCHISSAIQKALEGAQSESALRTKQQSDLIECYTQEGIRQRRTIEALTEKLKKAEEALKIAVVWGDFISEGEGCDCDHSCSCRQVFERKREIVKQTLSEIQSKKVAEIKHEVGTRAAHRGS